MYQNSVSGAENLTINYFYKIDNIYFNMILSVGIDESDRSIHKITNIIMCFFFQNGEGRQNILFKNVRPKKHYFC